MAWIESHESLPTHPKTKRMCRILKIAPVTAVGHLHFLWWWAMSHAQDGSLDRYTPDDVADACSWEGDAESFFNALIESKFIDRTSTGHQIHDWFVYAGKLIAIREKDAERKRTSRGKVKKSNGHPTDIQRTSQGSLTESIRDLDLDLNLDLNKENKDTTTDDFEIIRVRFRELHGIMDIHIDDYKLITKLLEDGIPRTTIVKVLESRFKPSARTIKYYEAAIREAHNGVVAVRQIKKYDPELEYRNEEIARNKWISEGNDPSGFVYKPASGS